MDRNSIRIATILFSLLSLTGAWFGVLYSEETQRLAQVAKEQAAFTTQLKQTDEQRKVYFESIQQNRLEQAATMDAAQQQYETLLQSQDAQIKAQSQTVTKIVEKPITKTQTVNVTKPATTPNRTTKTS